MNHHEVLKEFRVKKPPKGKVKRARKKEFELNMEAAAQAPAKRKAAMAHHAIQVMTEAELKEMAVLLYRKLGTLGSVAKALDKKRSTLERWMVEDEVFREDMIDAHETVLDRLERKAIKRALVDESDEMLKFMLRAGRPGKFNPQAIIAAEAALAASANNAAGGSGGGGGSGQKFVIAGQEVEF